MRAQGGRDKGQQAPSLMQHSLHEPAARPCSIHGQAAPCCGPGLGTLSGDMWWLAEGSMGYPAHCDVLTTLVLAGRHVTQLSVHCSLYNTNGGHACPPQRAGARDAAGLGGIQCRRVSGRVHSTGQGSGDSQAGALSQGCSPSLEPQPCWPRSYKGRGASRTEKQSLWSPPPRESA